ncbi:MAG: hypothetical protein NVV63_07995 [Opitutus sp.]|nr:hypothetical protein [Opitutus sp.]
MNKNPANITRIDVEKPHSQHCWEVKIVRKHGESFHKSFSDSKHGGKNGALAAAIRCRDEEIKKRPALNSFEQAIRLKKSNRSGTVGVRLGTKVVRRGTSEWVYPGYVVTGTPVSGGKPKTKYFTFKSYGSEKAAKAAALGQRRAWEKSLKASVEEKLKQVDMK